MHFSFSHYHRLVLDSCTNLYNVFPDAIGVVQEVGRLQNVVLGIRWASCKCVIHDSTKYTKANTDLVFKMLQEAGIEKMKGQPINFFVRAHLANRSRENLMELYEKLNPTNPVTFTMFSDEQYFPYFWCNQERSAHIKSPNITELRSAIMFFGAENVHLQVSDETRTALNLIGLPNPRATIQSTNGAASLVSYNSFLVLVAFMIVKFVYVHYSSLNFIVDPPLND